MRLLFISVFFSSFLAVSNITAQSFGAMNPGNETRIYPNPIILGQELHIESDSDISSVEVLDIIGKPIKQKKTESSDTKSMSVRLEKCKQGVYIVKIRFKHNKYAIKKLLVKNQ